MIDEHRKINTLRKALREDSTKRFKAISVGQGSAYSIYDEKRGCTIMKSVSPNATYNKDVAEEVANLLNSKHP